MHYHHSNQPTTAGTAVLTVSDTRTLHDDKSGKEIQNLLKKQNHILHKNHIVEELNRQ